MKILGILWISNVVGKPHIKFHQTQTTGVVSNSEHIHTDTQVSVQKFF